MRITEEQARVLGVEPRKPSRPRVPQPRSPLVEALLRQLQSVRARPPVLEHRFHPERMWRFDLAWPDILLAVECEGGVFSGGRHTRGKGYQADCQKYNAAIVMGWRVLRYTTRMIDRGEARDTISALLEPERWKRRRP